MLDKHFSKQEMEDIKALGGFDELMKTLEQRLKEILDLSDKEFNKIISHLFYNTSI